MASEVNKEEEKLEVINAHPENQAEINEQKARIQRRYEMLSKRQYHIHKASDYRNFAKVWRKYRKRNLRKNFGEDYVFVQYLIFEEEIEKYQNAKGYIGNLCRLFKRKFLGKVLAVDDNPKNNSTFLGMNLTNAGIFYIVEHKGKKYQVHQSNLSFR